MLPWVQARVPAPGRDVPAARRSVRSLPSGFGRGPPPGRGAQEAGSPGPPSRGGERRHLTPAPAPARGCRGTAAPRLRRYGGLAAGSAARPLPGGRAAGALLLPRRRPPPSPAEPPRQPPRPSAPRAGHRVPGDR